MNKKIFYILLTFIFCLQPVFAEKIPVKISPTQVISTHHDEIEVGDTINFEVAKDVFYNNHIYIKRGTPVIGFVSFIHENGWGSDSAEILIKNFCTKDISGKQLETDYVLNIKGCSDLANTTRTITIKTLTTATLISAGRFFRGAEIFVEPDSNIYNIFIEK